MQYLVIPAGPFGFQVMAAVEGVDHLIAGFASQGRAMAFAALMRLIDAGVTHSLELQQQRDVKWDSGYWDRYAEESANCAAMSIDLNL